MTVVSTSAPPLITEFIGHPLESAWDRAYVDAKRYAQEARGVAILDVTEIRANDTIGTGIRVDILVHVLRAADTDEPETHDRLNEHCQRQENDGQLTLALATFGEGAEEAAQIVFQIVGMPTGGQYRWIEGVTSLDELRLQLTDWLLVLVDMRRPIVLNSTSSESVLAVEMPTTSSGAEIATRRRLRGMP